MKLSCIRIGTDILIGKKQDDIISFLAKKMLGMGLPIQNVITTLNNPNNIFESINYLKSDIIVIIGENSSSKNHNIKKAISTLYDRNLIKNEKAELSVNSYFKQQNTPIPIENENEYYIPQGSELLVSDSTHLLGFTLTLDKKIIIFIPDSIDFINDVFDNKISNILNEKLNVKYKTHIIKLFGIYENDVYSILSDLIKNVYKILFVTYPDRLEVALHIRYNENLDDEIVRTFLAKVYERLKKYIYADGDVSLQQRAYDLLMLSNNTISLAEGSTFGALSNTFFQLKEFDKNTITQAVVCPNIESKISTLNISTSLIEKYGNSSVEIVYEMAVSMLEKSKSDYVIATSGDLEILDKDGKKTIHIAVGSNDGLHVYKSVFIGTKNQIVDGIVQTALFYLIKNIQQNDWILSKNTI